jgi:hypothetical protein
LVDRIFSGGLRSLLFQLGSRLLLRSLGCHRGLCLLLRRCLSRLSRSELLLRLLHLSCSLGLLRSLRLLGMQPDLCLRFLSSRSLLLKIDC